MFKVVELLKATDGRLINKGAADKVDSISIDSRAVKENHAFVAIKGNNFDGHDFVGEAIKNGASCVILQLDYDNLSAKGKIKEWSRCFNNVTFIGVEDTIKALGSIACFHRMRFRIPVIAVTGSNGKTTTKDMAAWILSAKFNVLKTDGTRNNYIGVALSTLNIRNSHTAAVLELGTNHAGEISYLCSICRPTIGLITNIGPSHLEYLRDLKGVFREKYSLIENLDAPYIAVLNADDKALRIEALKKGNSKVFVLTFGLKQKADFRAEPTKIINGKLIFSSNKHKFSIRTIGRHNVYNALAAVSIARILGMEYEDIITRASSFIFPQGRLNVVNSDCATVIDDTYNSNPSSLNQALNALADFKTKGRRIVVMGDMLELGDGQEGFHKRAGKDAAGVCDVLVTVGKLSRLAAKTAEACGFDTKNIFSCESSSQAKVILENEISPKKEDVVLLKGSRRMKMEEILNKKV